MKKWFKTRKWIYIIFLCIQFLTWMITGSDYPQKSYLLYSILHHILCVPILFVYSYYNIRLLLFRNKYALFMLASTFLVIVSGLFAVLFYHFVHNDKIHLNALIFNRLILLSVPLLFEIFIKNQEIIAKLSTIRLRQQIIQLNQQINPHLLFNAFTHLQKNILTQSPISEEIIIQIADLTRYSLKMSTHIFVELSEEIAYLTSYIELEKLRLNKTVRVDFEVQELIKHTKIPVMLLIVLVENAFKHVEAGGYVEIVLSAEQQDLFFSIENSTTNRMDVSSTKIGYQNLIKRLDIIYQKTYTFQIEANADFYRVLIQLPQLPKASILAFG